MLASASTSFAQAAHDPSAVESGAAKAQFANAQKLFKAGQYAEALPIFRDLAETTHSPNARLYVGHCLQQLGKLVDAHNAFSAVVKEITDHPEAKYEPTREAAIAQLAVLNVRLAKVVISLTDVPPDVAVTLDGAAVQEKDLGASIVVEPGRHRVDVSASGVAPIHREVNLDGGEVKALTLSLKKVVDGPAENASATGPTRAAAPTETGSEGGGTMRTAGLVVGGVGVAGLTVFTITGLMAKSTFNDLKAQCARGCADSDHLDRIERGKSLQMTANVGLAVGLIGLGAGAALFALGLQGRSDHAVSVSLLNGGGVVSYGTEF